MCSTELYSQSLLTGKIDFLVEMNTCNTANSCVYPSWKSHSMSTFESLQYAPFLLMEMSAMCRVLIYIGHAHNSAACLLVHVQLSSKVLLHAQMCSKVLGIAFHLHSTHSRSGLVQYAHVYEYIPFTQFKCAPYFQLFYFYNPSNQPL